MESPWALGLIILGPLFLPKLLSGTDEKIGPIFGSQIEPAKRVDPLWVHPFCGLQIPHPVEENSCRADLGGVPH